ncbi:MAG: hypothetical protein MPJ50_05540 [Pirellulales bacterium]|nr:hypothetical protein [Pirellulales bacterium]
MKRMALVVAACGLISSATANDSFAQHAEYSGGYYTGNPWGYVDYPSNSQWHAGYADAAWGRPMPLVIPPNAQYQTVYGWGIGATQVVPNYAQFSGPTYGGGYWGGPYHQAPRWPWDTRQLGVYYVRGPW